MSKRAPLSEKQRKLAQQDRVARKNSPVMSLEELRAQTPQRDILADYVKVSARLYRDQSVDEIFRRAEKAWRG
jgi:hypothetical protein